LVPPLDWPGGLLAACRLGGHVATTDGLVLVSSWQADSVDSKVGAVDKLWQPFPPPGE